MFIKIFDKEKRQ